MVFHVWNFYAIIITGGTMSTDSFSNTSLRTAFTYPFQSHDWLSRFVIGVALLFASLFIPVIPVLFVYGYVLEVMRQTIAGDPPVLPEWKDWGRLILDGLKSLGVSVVFLGPGLVVLVGGWITYMVMYFGGAIILANTPSYDSPPAYAFGLLLGGIGSLFLSMMVGSILLIAGTIPLPAALAHFVAREKLGAAFHVREWSAIIRADKWGYLISWVVILGLIGLMYIALMLAYLTIFLFCLAYLIFIPIMFYLMLISSVVFGQFYREGVARMTQPADSQDGGQI
jgi:hypothetical protein